MKLVEKLLYAAPPKKHLRKIGYILAIDASFKSFWLVASGSGKMANNQLHYSGSSHEI